MSVFAAFSLWCVHGVILWFNWGRYRPHIALLHGLGMGALGAALLWLGLSPGMMAAGGAAIGGGGALGHRLAPGLFIGNGLLFAVPFLLHREEALWGAAAFALASQLAVLAVGLARPSK